MARAKSVLLAGLLLSCLAATVFARPAVPEADAGDGMAMYDCPDTPKMKGCAATGCALHMHGRASTLVCAKCHDDKAYLLVNAGTRKAQCECAPGYGGKGQEGVCKKCPPGTDIASGGPILRSICLKCPKGSTVSADGLDCVCPAGTYRAVADQPAGYKRIACKPCAARAAYMEEDAHTRESCNTCRVPEVANTEHTKCVSPESSEAAPPGDGVIGAISKRAANTPLGSLAQAFEEGRHETQHQQLMRKEGYPVPSKASSSSGSSSTPAAAASPLKALADRFRSALGERKQADKMESAQQEAEEPVANTKAQTERDSDDEDYKGKREHKESRHSRDDEYYSKRERKHHSSHHDDGNDSEYYQDKRASKAQIKQETQATNPEQPKQEAQPQQQPQQQPQPQPQQQQEEKQQEKPAVKAPVVDSKDVGKNGDSNMATKLIPGLPVDPTPAPATAPTLADMAKKLGATLSKAAPRNPLPTGYIDPQALADAGLPPARNVAELMRGLMKSQIGDLDLHDWSHGVRGGN